MAVGNSPRSRSLSEIKDKLMHPALTSNFVVSIPKPSGLSDKYLRENGIPSLDFDKLQLLCSDAILPGSTLTTHDITGDYHGSTHRHAYRRLFDDRIDFTFYVDAVSYLPIRYFETWIKYIAGEQIVKGVKSESGRPGVQANEYFYRMNYPENYICNQGLEVTKFERSKTGNFKGTRTATLTYKFVNSFPIAIQSMPVSYESSSLLKCTVSFSYVRYFLDPEQIIDDAANNAGTASPSGASYGQVAANAFDPAYQASLNGLQFQGLNSSLPVYDFNQTLSVDTKNAYSTNLNLF